jgi:hypothetical protein
MALSCFSILVILGAGEIFHGLLCQLAGLTLTPRDHILSGLIIVWLGLAIDIGRHLHRWPGRRRDV